MEFLSKEEIKQWRSSLEKITLEEFAARLGKVVAESRPTNDIVDMVNNGNVSMTQTSGSRTEKFSNIAERAFVRERQLSHTPFLFKPPVEDKTEEKTTVLSETSAELIEKITNKQNEEQKVVVDDLREEVDIVLKKNLTDREQMVLDYFINHKNTTVYAKDLAVLLDLPRDYVYKYIKNLRAKIEGDKLKNADRGGFIFTN